MEKNYCEFARFLFDKLKSAYPDFCWYKDYASDDGKSYEEAFEKVLFEKLNECPNNYTRNDLDRVAECFQKIASKEKSELLFLKYLYECMEETGEDNYLEKDEVLSLIKFLTADLKHIAKASNNMNNSCNKPNFLFLSYYWDPSPYWDEILDGKGEALLRAINEKYSLESSTISLPYENKVKEFFMNQELRGVNWITSLDDVNDSKRGEFDFIYLVDPKLCEFNYAFLDDGDYIIDGVKDFRPLSKTLDKYGNLVKSGGRIFLVVESIAADYELLKRIQREATDNMLYMETVVYCYSFKSNINRYGYNAVYDNCRSGKLAVIVLRKDAPGTDYVKILNIDNTMDGEYVEKLVEARYSERFGYKETLAFLPQRVFFSDVSDYKEQTEKLYYNTLENYYRFIYKDGANSSFIKLVKKLYDDNYEKKTEDSVSKSDWLYINDLAKLTESLGLYYSGHQDLTRLKKAKDFLEIALWCRMDVGEELETVESKIAKLESAQSPLADIKKQFTVLCPIDLNENDKNALFTDIENFLKMKFEEKHWNALRAETRIYIQTAVFSFLQYLNSDERLQSKIDYSGVISLLMRALELELKERFCLGYLAYLQKKYPNPYNYLKTNNLEYKFRGNNRDIKGIVKYVKDEGQLYYISYDGSNTEDSSYYFSLGKAQNFTGYVMESNKNGTAIRVDKTFLEYLAQRMKGKSNHFWSEDEKEREKRIKLWVSKISKAVATLKGVRNDASHGGKVLNVQVAMQAFESLILVKKILKELVTPF